MNFIIWIVIGGVLGWVASIIMRTNAQQGIFLNVVVGIIGALLALGVPAFRAAAAGAWIHGQAARLGPSRGLVAGDLLPLIPQVLETL